jgi:hypothetical protein
MGWARQDQGLRRLEQAEGQESALSRGRRRRDEQQPRTGEGILDPRHGRRGRRRGRAWGSADLSRRLRWCGDGTGGD